MQPILELQRLQTHPAQTVDIFLFNEHPLFITQLHTTAMALGDITQFALEAARTSRAGLDLMLRHRLPVKSYTCIEHGRDTVVSPDLIKFAVGQVLHICK